MGPHPTPVTPLACVAPMAMLALAADTWGIRGINPTPLVAALLDIHDTIDIVGASRASAIRVARGPSHTLCVVRHAHVRGISHHGSTWTRAWFQHMFVAHGTHRSCGTHVAGLPSVHIDPWTHARHPSRPWHVVPPWQCWLLRLTPGAFVAYPTPLVAALLDIHDTIDIVGASRTSAIRVARGPSHTPCVARHAHVRGISHHGSTWTRAWFQHMLVVHGTHRSC